MQTCSHILADVHQQESHCNNASSSRRPKITQMFITRDQVMSYRTPKQWNSVQPRKKQGSSLCVVTKTTNKRQC